MTVRSRRTALLASALARAAPAPAWAQSAGDEQYEDPFGGDQQEQPQPEATARPAPVSPTPAPAQPAQAPAPATGATQGQLPYTDADALLAALAGTGLIAAGAGLRLRRDGAR